MSAATIVHERTAGSADARQIAHESSGDANARFGMWLFLLSEAIMFGSFFAQYFYSRAQAAQWPPEGVERVPAAPLALVLTIILIVSGFTAHNADSAIRRGDQEKLQGWLALTIALGILFLAGQAFEYSNLLAGRGVFGEADFAPFGINSGIYGTAFYALTGLHGIHVTFGILTLGFVLLRATMGHFSARRHFAVEGAVLYWHFVDIVWLALYLAVYLF